MSAAGKIMQKIALEEHFLTPNLVDHWRTTLVNINPDLGDKALGALTDFGDRRLEAMAANGIGYAVLSISGPGVQVEREAIKAVRLAREANDLLAREIQTRPHRYGGVPPLPLHGTQGPRDRLQHFVPLPRVPRAPTQVH